MHSMHNRNNEFILCDKKMADFECRQFETWLEFVRRSFTECNNFSEGSSQPKKDVQVIPDVLYMVYKLTFMYV